MMIIRGCKTVEEYKAEQYRRIQQWVDANFVSGSVTWVMDGASHIKLVDKTGDSMLLSLDDID